MPTVLVHVVAAFLLLVQALVAMAPGKVICIPVGICASAEAAVEHCHAHHGHGHHDHGPVDPGSHDHEGCACHLHLPLPDDHQPTAKPLARAIVPEMHCLLIPVLLAELEVPEESARAPGGLAHPPDRPARDQMLGLRSTRLLI